MTSDILNLCEYVIGSKKNAFLRFTKEKEPYIAIQEISIQKLKGNDKLAVREEQENAKVE